MSEPPGGTNHGRQRNSEGRWTPLEPMDWMSLGGEVIPVSSEGEPSFKRYAGAVKHGTLHAYTRRKCRCDECREAMATWKRGRRRV
jgi:hypothetical protein